MNYYVIFGIIILAFVTSIVLSAITMRMLRTKHPETWMALGRPKRIDLNQKITPDAEPFWVSGYKKLNDPKFAEQVELLKTFNKIFGIISLVFIILMIAKLVIKYA